MKLNAVFSLASLVAVVASKNVVKPEEFFNIALENGAPQKRDAKNVVSLEDLKIALENESPKKREAKNVINLDDLKIALEHETIQKREPKNVINLNDFKIALEETKSTKSKRKYVFDLASFQQAVSKEGQDKREDVQLFFKIDLEDSKQNILQSVLPLIKDISIMSGYIRDNEQISAKTELTNETMIIIAPSNDAISNKLEGYKPWEFPRPIVDSDDETVEKILKYNLNSFLSHHIVVNFEENLQIENETRTILTKLMNGDSIRIKQDQVTDEFAVQLESKKGKTQNWIRVESVKQVDNGFIFVIDETLVKP
ncbi:hypothetical protein PICST_84683 [Scheffersomyces stipitis CBS 6054]|uniref:FAS1 domain-containing protein n=1 Tax=Scheffersomyces stipitis (strain ATCC 58785 / CBS 6054 / NBRC 10063 / NRRL Y-11545) TaxID=322104 RepID=A3LXH9_PICST|nr:hypothetical protein PICST_84683 [Scheffersomyces stipitis CBS 6054]ABN67809.2 hypothetical protein PICST_84683 [Scheffersomyces stipitis CBS 6054]KAG2732266.1 hypothetical protein G9P44_004683 [Scheffersomyces stipitis]